MKTVARETGLSPLLIRAWERRYAIVQPRRASNGFREYTALDVRVLRAARALVSQGRPIGEVAALPRQRLLDEGEAAEAGAQPSGERPIIDEIDAIVAAIHASDGEAARVALDRTFSILSPERAIDTVLVPVLRKVGELWERGALTPAQEHLGTDLIRLRIRGLVEAATPYASSSRGVAFAACLPGEKHDLPLLFAAHRLARQGYVPVILGADVPLRDVISMARARTPAIVALSSTLDEPYRQAARALSKLRSQLPTATRLVIGGQATRRFAEQLRAWGFEVEPREPAVK